jgi:hypothetical protein
LPEFIDSLPGGNGTVGVLTQTVKKCPRCGQNHGILVLRLIQNPFSCRLPDPAPDVLVYAPMSHYAICPNGGGPLLFTIIDTNDRFRPTDGADMNVNLYKQIPADEDNIEELKAESNT